MLTYFDLRRGVIFSFENEPYEVLEFQQIRKAQDITVAKTKIKNLVSGKITEKNFHQDDVFEEAEVEKKEVKFIYSNRNKFVFCEADNPSKRFDLSGERIGDAAQFLKPNMILTGLKFKDKIINIKLPIKVQLKVIEAPPGVKGNRAQSGTKIVTLETNAKINVPLFIEPDDIIELNTETGEYSRRIEK